MNKKQEILKQAELKVRQGGYNNFSFRELATDVGIKSASVHYYFPTKADLGAELAAQYTDTFLMGLGDPVHGGKDLVHPVLRYVEAFRNALTVDKKMCLCGLFGAEIAGLPDKVRLETEVFFKKNIDWLTSAFVAAVGKSETDARKEAIKLVSLLEGAMLISNAMQDFELFDASVADIVAVYQ